MAKFRVGDKVRLVRYDYPQRAPSMAGIRVGSIGEVLFAGESVVTVRFENVVRPMFAENEGWALSHAEIELVEACADSEGEQHDDGDPGDETTPATTFKVGDKVRIVGYTEWWDCDECEVLDIHESGDISVEHPWRGSGAFNPKYIAPVGSAPEYKVGDRVRVRSRVTGDERVGTLWMHPIRRRMCVAYNADGSSWDWIGNGEYDVEIVGYADDTTSPTTTGGEAKPRRRTTKATKNPAAVSADEISEAWRGDDWGPRYSPAIDVLLDMIRVCDEREKEREAS